MDSDGPPRISPTVVATLANDLRNILTVIVSCFDSVRNQVPPSPGNDRHFADLDSAVDAAFNICREMLEIARPRAAGLEPAVVDVNEVVAHTRDMVERIVGESIGVSLHLAAATPVVRADVVQLEWVLLNLASNAADAMPNGGRLRLETASVDIPPHVVSAGPFKGRRHVRLTASDTGPGMPPEVRRGALEPFFTTREGKTGLGLTSVAMTVQRLGGSLRLRNNTPRGTCVDVYLPLLGPASQPSDASSQ